MASELVTSHPSSVDEAVSVYSDVLSELMAKHATEIKRSLAEKESRLKILLLKPKLASLSTSLKNVMEIRKKSFKWSFYLDM